MVGAAQPLTHRVQLTNRAWLIDQALHERGADRGDTSGSNEAESGTFLPPQYDPAYPGGAQADSVQPVQPAADDLPAGKPNTAQGILVGAVVAIVVGAVWYLVVTMGNIQIGFLAIGIGFAIGIAMRWAAGPGESRALQVAALLLTLVTMFFAEFFIARTFIGEAFVAQGDSSPLRLFLAPADMFSVVAESIRLDPLTLLFWLIALSGAYRTTRADAGPQRHDEQDRQPAPEAEGRAF